MISLRKQNRNNSERILTWNYTKLIETLWDYHVPQLETGVLFFVFKKRAWLLLMCSFEQKGSNPFIFTKQEIFYHELAGKTKSPYLTILRRHIFELAYSLDWWINETTSPKWVQTMNVLSKDPWNGAATAALQWLDVLKFLLRHAFYYCRITSEGICTYIHEFQD